jgi:hypothetical protein
LYKPFISSLEIITPRDFSRAGFVFFIKMF